MIEAVLDQVPRPHVPGSDYLLKWFFEFGPCGKDGPVTVPEVLKWGDALGIEWKPWQTRLFVRLSREYVAEQYRARDVRAAPPWPDAAPMWRWVQSQKGERSLDQEERRAARRAKKPENS